MANLPDYVNPEMAGAYANAMPGGGTTPDILSLLSVVGQGAPTVAPAKSPKGVKSWLSSMMAGGKGAKAGIGGAAALIAMQGIINAMGTHGQESLSREAIASQTRATTPEDLYYQAALPSAQQEEASAREALLQHMSGGLIGPSLAKGERLIGG